MKLLLKTVGYIFAGLAGLVVLAFIVLQLISDEQYKKWIVGAAASATGRELAIDGPFELNIGSRVGLLASNVRFANAPWASREDMATIERLFVELRLLPLIKGVLDVTVELDGPDIQLETNEAGQGNWAFGSKEAEPPEETKEQPPTGAAETSFSLPVKPYIRNLEIKDLAFVFKKNAQGNDLRADVEHLRIFVDETNIPLILKATYQGAPLELGGSLGDIEQWQANQQTGIALTGKLNEADLSITGSAGPMLPRPAASLDLVLAAESISTFSPFAGQAIPELQGLNASLTFLAADGRLATENVKLNLDDPRLLVTVEGVIADLTELSGIDLRAEVNSEQAAELIKSLDLNIQYSLPRTLRLKAGVNGNLEQLSVRDLDLLVKDTGLDLSLTGQLENVFDAAGGGADLLVNLESTSIIGGYLGQELPPLGPFNLVAKLSSGNKNLQLESLKLDLQDPALTARIDGSAQRIGRSADGTFEMSGIELNVEAATGALEEIIARVGVELPAQVPSTFNLKASSAGSLEKIEITDLLATLKDPGLEVNLSGTADNVIELSGIAAQLTALVDDTARLTKFTGVEVPALGSLNLKTNLSSAADSYRLDDLELLLDGELVKAKISGAVKDLMALTKTAENPEAYAQAGIEAALDMQTGSIAELGKLAGVEIPELGALKVAGKLGSANNSLALENLDLTLSGDEVEATVKAAVADLMALAGVAEDRKNLGKAAIDVTLEANTSAVSNLVNKVSPGINLPELGSLEVNGHLGSTERSVKLDLLKASLTQNGIETKADVMIEDVLKLSGIKAAIDGNLDSLSTLSELAKRELPQTGPWVVNIQADTENPASPVTIVAQLEGEGTKTIIKASLPDVMAPQTFETQLDIEAESIVRVGRLLGREAPKDKPLKITGNAAGKPGDYRINEFLIEAGESKIMADLAYLVPLEGASGRKNISGQVTIENFDSNAWLISQEKVGDPATEEGTSVETVETKSVDAEKAATEGTKQKAATGKKIFSNEPLSLGVLNEYDAELKLDVTNMLVRNEITLNGTVGINLDQGLLKIDPFEIDQSSGATGNGYLTLDARNPEAQLDIVFDFDNFVSPRFGGQIDLNVDLDGSGESLAELMGSLNGHFVASINDIELKKSFMSNFGAGLLSQLNPLDSDTTILECAVVRFDITDGIADFHKKIAAQTKEVSWLGGGEINLKTEELDFGISPKPRGAISSLTNIDLASLVHVGGTLAEPRIGVDALDVAKKYGEYTAFIATGGLSFLAQKAFETTQANMNHCERILADLEQEGGAEQPGEDEHQGEKKSN
jgi:uncharacterized protein involved in outer membrane biogenesis